MQLCSTIYCPSIALHVSSDIIAHHQELLNCTFTASGDTYVCHCLQFLVIHMYVTVCQCRRRIRTSSDSPMTLAGSNIHMYYQKLQAVTYICITRNCKQWHTYVSPEAVKVQLRSS
jgi:hypothetical protein